MTKPTLATIWLDGCSGCHMSFLDMDERLFDITERADIVFSPLVDVKEYPHDVDFCLVEGAVSSEEDLHKIRQVRERTRTLISFGDCAVNANVPKGRDPATLTVEEAISLLAERIAKGGGKPARGGRKKAAPKTAKAAADAPAKVKKPPARARARKTVAAADAE